MFLKSWVAAVVLATASTAWADSTAITLYPGLPGVNVLGNTTTSSPGFPNSSWQANASGAGAKSELYIPVSALFSHPVLISDIASISYSTNKPGDSGSPDWSLLIYTNLTGTGDAGSFYHSRLVSEPYLTNTSNAADPANTWHLWSTDDASNPLRFYDSSRDGGVLGTYTDPTLGQLTSGPVTWNSPPETGATVDYRSDSVKYFSLQTGSGWANGFNGLVDGMTIQLTNGDIATVNLEAAPTPLPSVASTSMVLLAVLGAGGFIRRRMRAVA